MKILYHHRTRSKDGQNVHIEELTHALRTLGHELIIVEPGGQEAQDFGSGAGFVDTLKARLPAALYEVAEFCYSFVAYRKLAAAYRQHHPVVLYERYSLFLLAGRWLARRYNVPFLLEINAPLAAERSRFDGLSLRSFAAWCERKTWRGADLCLPVSAVLADHVARAGVPQHKIHVIHNAVNPERFLRNMSGDGALPQLRQRYQLGDRKILGFTGFMRDWHGLEQVLDVMAAWPEEQRHQWHFLVVGEGPARATLEARADALGLTQALTVTGVVPRDDIAAHVALFDIALQPRSVAYASPLKAFEYMALARAIIAPDQPNIREVLVHNETAWLFEPNQAHAFAKGLTLLAEDGALRQRLGQAARQAIHTKGLTWAHNAADIVERAESLSK